jgi:carbon-monoxide dehydrogenase medium subunit
MPTYNQYFIPNSIEDALRVLSDYAPGSVSLVAGGTDLLLDLRQGRHCVVDALVDVNHIPELQRFQLEGDNLYIGAAVPLNQITESPLVIQYAQALSEATGLIGGPQVRNTATLGGNVAHALPAGDGTISMLSLNAQADIASKEGIRRIPLGQLFNGPGQSTLDPCGELIVGFVIPACKPGEASSFKRVMRPQGVALPILNMSAWIKRVDDRIEDIRLAVGPAGRTPQRGSAAEDVLRGHPLSDDLMDAALEALLQSISLRTSKLRATKEYRTHLAGVLLRDVLQCAWQRCGDNLKVVK